MVGMKSLIYTGATSLLLGFTSPNLENQNNQDYLMLKKDSLLSKQQEFVQNARNYLNTEWIYGGRLTKKNPGLDCLGVVFLAHAKTYGTKWFDISVYPSKIIEKEQLGKPVKSLDGVLNDSIDFSKLEEGDVIYFMDEESNSDKHVSEIDNLKYWVWHTGIYSDKEKNLFLHASPWDNKVQEEDFKNFLDEHNSHYDAIFITRMD